MKKNHDFDIGLNSYVRKCILMGFLLLGLSIMPLAGEAQNKEVRLTLKMENATLQAIFGGITEKPDTTSCIAVICWQKRRKFP